VKAVEAFFQKHLSDPELRVVTPDNSACGNTPPVAGAHPLYILNLNTVKALADASGEAIDWRRFRPNVLITDMPAWAEFTWVGQKIAAGSAVLRVTKRTVRCDATKVDPVSCHNDLDVPGLLSKHFPQHGPYIGVYAIVEKPGTLSEGSIVGLL
jgi:uncharacterized protein YcbX